MSVIAWAAIGLYGLGCLIGGMTARKMFWYPLAIPAALLIAFIIGRTS